MEKKLTVDRVEEGIAVCFDNDGNKYELQAQLTEGEIFTALLSEDGDITVLCRHETEEKEKKSKNSSRLRSLFNRGDKRS